MRLRGWSTTSLAFLALIGQACTTWVTQRVPPPVAWADSVRQHRVTLTTGARHVIGQVSYQDDTLRGIANRSKDSIAVAVRDIARLQTRRFDPAKTVGLVAGVAFLMVVANAVVAADFDLE